MKEKKERKRGKRKVKARSHVRCQLVLQDLKTDRERPGQKTDREYVTWTEYFKIANHDVELRGSVS